MNIKHLQGLVAAPFTPFKKNGSLNLSIIPSYYKLLKENGVTGAFICGSTGEGVSLTTAEKMFVAEAWADCTRKDDEFKVMTLVGGTSITDCRDLAKHASKIGLYAVSFTAPFYFKPTSATQLAACCKAVAEAAPELPFYYYHIPVLTGVDLAMTELLKAVDGEIPNFAGIKYTHEDFMDFLSCLNYANGKYDMLWGRDENLLPSLAIGAKAAVGSTFNYAAPLYHQLIEAFNHGDLEGAQQLQQKAIDMITLLGKYGGISTGKSFMKLIGMDCGQFRLPVANMSREQFSEFERETKQIGFAEFCSRVSSSVKN